MLLSRLVTRRSALTLNAYRSMGGAVGHVAPGTISSKTGLPVRDTPLPRHPSEYLYEDRFDKPIPIVPFVEEPNEAQKALLSKMKGAWTSLSNEEKEQLYRLRFQWSIDELRYLSEKNYANILSLVVALFFFGVSNYYIIGFYMWDRSPKPQTFTEPRMTPLRSKVKKFLNKCNDIVNPDYLEAKVKDLEIPGVELP